MAVTGTPQLDPVKQELVAELVQRELKAAVTLLPTITDFSSLAVPGAKTIKIPKLTSFTVVNRASQAAGTPEDLSATTDDMNLDRNAYVQWIIDSFDEIQANIPAQAEFALRAAAAHGRFVDSQIIGEMETVGVEEATATGNVTRDIVLAMRKQLLQRNADKNALFMAVGPEQEEALLKIDEFTRADIYGTSNIPDGMIGRVYGVNIIMNNQLANDQYFMYERTGMSVAFQQRANLVSETDIDYGSNARKFVLDQIFGVKGLQLGQEGVGATLSALVVKDANA